VEELVQSASGTAWGCGETGPENSRTYIIGRAFVILGIAELIIVIIVAFLILVGIAGTIWALSMLGKTRSAQDEVLRRLDAIEEQLRSGSGRSDSH
jgi:hypothetical protein